MSPLRNRSIAKILLGIAVFVMVAYGVLGFVIYDGLSQIGDVCAQNRVNRPDQFSCITNCDAWQTFDFSNYWMPDYEQVHFPSRDGLQLSGWFVATDPDAPAIVVVHGYQVCKYHHHSLAQAGALHRAGFNVLLFDQRDCGDSQIVDERSGYGSEEYLDALGAFDFLHDRGFADHRIGMHGSSLGGAITLTAFAKEPRLQAIFLDSPLVDARAEFAQYTGLPDALFPGVEWAARIVSGDELLRHDPLDGIRRANGRAVSVVHGTRDKVVRASHTLLLLDVARQAGVDVDVWMPENVGHVSTLAAHPGEYEQRMQTFFHSHL